MLLPDAAAGAAVVVVAAGAAAAPASSSASAAAAFPFFPRVRPIVLSEVKERDGGRGQRERAEEEG